MDTKNAEHPNDSNGREDSAGTKLPLTIFKKIKSSPAFQTGFLALFSALAIAALVYPYDGGDSSGIGEILIQVSAVMIAITGLLIYSRKNPSFLGWIGIIFIAALVTRLLGVVSESLLDTSFQFGFEANLDYFLSILFTSYILSSLVGTAIAKKLLSDVTIRVTKMGESILEVIKKKPLVSSPLLLLYFSAIGYIYEYFFYQSIGLRFIDHADPTNLAFAVLDHPGLTAGVGLCVLLALGLSAFLWSLVINLQHATEAWDKLKSSVKLDAQRNQKKIHKLISKAKESILRFGLTLMQLPTKLINILLIVPIIAMFFVIIFGPALGAYMWSNEKRSTIEANPSGRLTLSNPAVYGDGFKHVKSTDKHMILVYRQCAGKAKNESEASPTNTTDSTPNPKKPSPPTMVTSAVIPWGLVASFEVATPDRRVGGIPPEGEQLTKPPNCFEGWKSLDVANSADGDVTTITVNDPFLVRYSSDNETWNDSLDPALHRYIQFKDSDDKDFSLGIRFVGEDALSYGFMFPLGTLSNSLSSMISANHGTMIDQIAAAARACRTDLVVTGYASSQGFFQRGEVEPIKAVPNQCRRGDKPTVDYDCGNDTKAREQLTTIDRILNCGLANLRAIQTMAKVSNRELENPLLLDSNSLETPLTAADFEARAEGRDAERLERLRFTSGSYALPHVTVSNIFRKIPSLPDREIAAKLLYGLCPVSNAESANSPSVAFIDHFDDYSIKYFLWDSSFDSQRFVNANTFLHGIDRSAQITFSHTESSSCTFRVPLT